MTLTFEYRFHAVGQGLFSSHVIYENSEPRFWWVYDCGTSSPLNLLRDEIDKLRGDVRKRALKEDIDLVFISHFDEDHINGLVLLLEQFRVKTLVLPYVPQWQRLIIALEKRVSFEEDVSGFFIDPVNYLLTTVGPDRIEKILFVPSRRDGDPIEIGEIGDPTPSGDWQLGYRTQNGAARLMRPNGIGLHEGIQVDYLNPSYPMRLGSLWEFIPYNDERFSPKKSEFKEDVDATLKIINGSKDQAGSFDKQGAEKALASLKKTYVDTFGSSSYRQNVISLALYSGPFLNKSQSSRSPLGYLVSTEGGGKSAMLLDDRRGAQLLMGDGYLNSRKRLTTLMEYLAGGIDRLGVMQVMHHGSRANWREGVGEALNPLCAVFPAEPSHYGHPHAEVVKDFAGSHHAFVTEKDSFRFAGAFRA